MTEEKNIKDSDSVETASESQESKLAKVKAAIVNVIDENGNGEIDIEDVIVKGLRTPGIKINRAEFLKKQLLTKYPEAVIDVAIAESPMVAKIPLSEIDKIADEVIQYERNCVSGISAALGLPGGVAMVATIPADIIQYYGYLLRATQKLLYLYGFPQIETDGDGSKLDDATLNTLILCFGVMYGTVGASNALKSLAKALGSGVEKQLLKKALTKGTIYPIVKNVSKWFGIKMTKEVFAGFFKKAIPFFGGLLGGGLTYLSFKPCCVKLKKALRNTILSDPDYNPIYQEDDLITGDDQKRDGE